MTGTVTLQQPAVSSALLGLKFQLENRPFLHIPTLKSSVCLGAKAAIASEMQSLKRGKRVFGGKVTILVPVTGGFGQIHPGYSKCPLIFTALAKQKGQELQWQWINHHRDAGQMCSLSLQG